MIDRRSASDPAEAAGSRVPRRLASAIVALVLVATGVSAQELVDFGLFPAHGELRAGGEYYESVTPEYRDPDGVLLDPPPMGELSTGWGGIVSLSYGVTPWLSVSLRGEYAQRLTKQPASMSVSSSTSFSLYETSTTFGLADPRARASLRLPGSDVWEHGFSISGTFPLFDQDREPRSEVYGDGGTYDIYEYYLPHPSWGTPRVSALYSFRLTARPFAIAGSVAFTTAPGEAEVTGWNVTTLSLNDGFSYESYTYRYHPANQLAPAVRAELQVFPWLGFALGAQGSASWGGSWTMGSTTTEMDPSWSVAGFGMLRFMPTDGFLLENSVTITAFGASTGMPVVLSVRLTYFGNLLTRRARP